MEERRKEGGEEEGGRREGRREEGRKGGGRVREKRMERVKEVSSMIRSSGIKSEHSLSHTHTHTQGRE